MKKLNNKGFTLIELLAVITIMGILMMVAIPSVSRTIENARRDTFAETAGKYLDTVRNSFLADEIECQQNSGWVAASATPNGIYYLPICTSNTAPGCNAITSLASGSGAPDTSISKDQITQTTKDLMESGGKSSFGNADVVGYVKWVKDKDTKGNGKVTYSVYLTDAGNHGLSSEQQQAGLKRSNVATQGVTHKVKPSVTSPDVAYACKLA